MQNKSMQLPILPMFKKFIASSKNGKRLTTSGKRFSPGTIQQYKCVYKLLLEYEEKYETQLRVELIRKWTLTTLKKEKKYWDVFFRNFSGFMYHKKHYYDQYCSSVCKIIKTFFNYIRTEKVLPIGEFYKQFRISGPQATPVVLAPQQLQFLINNMCFEESLPKSLKRTKDIFVFGCTVALRYGDLMKLKRQNIIDDVNGLSIQLHTQKTGSQVNIPLPHYLVKIITKYKKRTRNYLLPRLSGTNFNLQVKRLIGKAGWTHELPKMRFRQGKIEEVRTKNNSCMRFCDHITAHTMRRTAITTLLMMGVPENVVRRISGHTAASKEFYRYVVIAQDLISNHVIKAHEKLLATSPPITNNFIEKSNFRED